MNFGTLGVQRTFDQIINNFCYSNGFHEMEFRKELEEFISSENSHIGKANEDGVEIMLEALWSLIATKDKGYRFAILVGSMMAVEPPTPLNFMKNYAPDLLSVILRVSCFAKFLPLAKVNVKETADTVSLYVKPYKPGYGASYK